MTDKELTAKLTTFYKNLSPANKRLMVEAMSDLAFYKKKKDDGIEGVDCNDGISVCEKVIRMLDCENNSTMIDEIVYTIGKLTGVALEGILEGFIMNLGGTANEHYRHF